MNAIRDLGESLKPTIRRLFEHCPRLSTLLLSQVMAYNPTRKFFRFTAPGSIRPERSAGTERFVGEGPVEGGDEAGGVAVECEIHDLSEWVSMSM